MHYWIQQVGLLEQGVWFPLAVGFILLIFIILMRKRLSWGQIYFIFGIVAAVTFIMDISIMATILDLMDLGTPNKVRLGDIFSFGVVSSCMAIIYTNYFHQDRIWKYVILFTIISVLFEWTLVQVGFMKLKGWQTWWSIPVYIVIYRYWLPWQYMLFKNTDKVEAS